MSLDKETMGFEGQMFVGPAGSTASTQVTKSRDITISTDPEFGDTTTRGDGSAPPVNTSSVVAINWSSDWNMTDNETDTTLAMMKAAAEAGTPIALRMKDKAEGKGFDGDVNLSRKSGKPLKGESTNDFTATPTLAGGRAPKTYV